MFSLFSFLFSTLIVENMNIKGIFCVNKIVHILEYGNVMMQCIWLAILILSHCHCDNMNIDEHCHCDNINMNIDEHSAES